MIIVGAGGHAVELLSLLKESNMAGPLAFFDNVSQEIKIASIRNYPILRNEEMVRAELSRDNRFILGIGNPIHRQNLSKYFETMGGVLISAIANTALISSYGVQLGDGLNIMHGVIIHPEVSIGMGTLINCRAVIHHETKIGSYCEICPGATITGRVTIGDRCMIGSGSIILPDIRIGDNARIGAGSVVTRNVETSTTVVGNPARLQNIN